MVAVLQDHFLRVFDRLRLPALVADVLPAGDLRKYQKTQSVTGIQEVMALRIMRCSDRIDAEFFLQDPGIFSPAGCPVPHSPYTGSTGAG